MADTHGNGETANADSAFDPTVMCRIDVFERTIITMRFMDHIQSLGPILPSDDFGRRFDLAGTAVTQIEDEILWICIIGAVLCLANYWVEDIAGDDFNRSLLSTAFILAVWGFGVYRYYRLHADLFVN